MSMRSALIFSTTFLIIFFAYMYKDEKRFMVTATANGIYIFDTKTQRVNLCDNKRCYVIQSATPAPAFMPSYYGGSLDGGVPYGMFPIIRSPSEYERERNMIAADIPSTPSYTPPSSSSLPSYESKYYKNAGSQY